MANTAKRRRMPRCISACHPREGGDPDRERTGDTTQIMPSGRRVHAFVRTTDGWFHSLHLHTHAIAQAPMRLNRVEVRARGFELRAQGFDVCVHRTVAAFSICPPRGV